VQCASQSARRIAFISRQVVQKPQDCPIIAGYPLWGNAFVTMDCNVIESGSCGLDPLLEKLVTVAEVQDGFSLGHSVRVQEYSRVIGLRLGLPAPDLHELVLGALLHDIGKIGVPAGILSSPTSLSEAQFNWVRRHPAIGHDLLRDRPELQSCLQTVLRHHERMDGSGYPHGLCGEDIPLHARIVAVADVFDAMTSDRSYRRALRVEEVMEHLLTEADCGRLDGKIVRILADTMEEVLVRDGAPACAA
jgi:HD-GYP domain-containing protein (c-di-GMP phosphodiesterase class II)